MNRSRLTAAALSAATIAASITTATTIPAASATATAAAWRPRFARTRFVDGERSSFDRFAVYFRDCLLGILVGAHSHKSEAAGFAGKFVLHEHDFLHRASLRKELL
jgi:hypothetical protein